MEFVFVFHILKTAVPESAGSFESFESFEWNKLVCHVIEVEALKSFFLSLSQTRPDNPDVDHAPQLRTQALRIGLGTLPTTRSPPLRRDGLSRLFL
jgi:hypothetical protein